MPPTPTPPPTPPPASHRRPPQTASRSRPPPRHSHRTPPLAGEPPQPRHAAASRRGTPATARRRGTPSGHSRPPPLLARERVRRIADSLCGVRHVLADLGHLFGRLDDAVGVELDANSVTDLVLEVVEQTHRLSPSLVGPRTVAREATPTGPPVLPG